MEEGEMSVDVRVDESIHDLKRFKASKSKNDTTLKNFCSNVMTMKSDGKFKGKEKVAPLKKLITKKKVNILKENFVNKMKLNSVHRQPIDEQDENYSMGKEENYFQRLKQQLENKNGISLGNIGLTIWSFANIIQITMMVFIFSIMMAFPKTTDKELFLYFRIFSVTLYVIDMVLNFTTQRFESGKQLKNILEISRFYLKNGFVIDLISILIFPVDLLIEANITLLTTGMAVTKLWGNLRKFERFEYMYIDSAVREQYYGLVKVFLTNFVIGHVLSILLNLMAPLSATNWWTKLGIQDQDWLVKYIWGYYWGTNIMLTVGFGDLSATNSYEALILIFIETFSCITLAYNISYVGAIIGSIREREEERKKKLKFFHRMCKENEISPDLQTKVTNFIQESYSIKEAFSFDDYDSVIQALPKSMQLEYRKEANQTIFDSFGGITNFSKKTLIRLAEIVERRVCHPGEIVLKKGDLHEFMILQKGTLDFQCKVGRGKSKLDGKVVESLEVQDGEKPKLLGLEFIKNKTLTHDIRSKNYSIIYTLELERFKEALRASEMDYQLMCILRDRYEYLLDENNVHACPLCPRKFHSKFQCPRLHYCPIKQMAIYRFLDQTKKMKSPRIPFLREKQLFTPLKNAQFLGQFQNLYIQEYFNEDEQCQIQNIMKFHKRSTSIQSEQKQQSKRRKSSSSPQKNLPSSPSIDVTTIQNLMNTYRKDHQFWNLEVDQASNFKYYHEEGNPSRLQKKNLHKMKKRM